MTDDAPPDSDAPPDGFELRAWVRRFRETDHGAVVFARETVKSVLLVALIGLVLFGASGVWPPMVAVESPSMEPHMSRGDLVLVMDEERFSPEFATDDTGVVTYRTGEREGYRSSGDYGDVIIFRPDGSDRETPTIHRAMFWVEEGENWYDRANPDHVLGDDCEAIPNCPAPNAGFISKGDNNRHYDQVGGISRPVRPSWIRATAEVRLPYLGHLRLALDDGVTAKATAT
jgi:signal peptidase